MKDNPVLQVRLEQAVSLCVTVASDIVECSACEGW